MCSVTLRTVFVGLDDHASSVQVCVLAVEGTVLLNRKCANDWRAVMGAVRERCGLEVTVQAAIESCCGAADLADELISHGWMVQLAHPGYVKRMKQSPDKTDFSDARMLADLERVGYLPRVWLAPEEVRELRRLVHYRQTLTKERKNLKLQIGATLREARQKAPANVNPWTLAWLAWLDKSAELSPNARHVTNRRLRRLKDLQPLLSG
jgi:transposase